MKPAALVSFMAFTDDLKRAWTVRDRDELDHATLVHIGVGDKV